MGAAAGGLHWQSSITRPTRRIRYVTRLVCSIAHGPAAVPVRRRSSYRALTIAGRDRSGAAGDDAVHRILANSTSPGRSNLCYLEKTRNCRLRPVCDRRDTTLSGPSIFLVPDVQCEDRHTVNFTATSLRRCSSCRNQSVSDCTAHTVRRVCHAESCRSGCRRSGP